MVNILLEIFVYRAVFTGHAFQFFIEQDEFFFGNFIDHFIHIIPTLAEMREDDHMGIIIELLREQSFEQREVTIINIEIDAAPIADLCSKGIVDDLFMFTELVEQQQYFKWLAQIGVLYKISFA